jgi:hypothetical protein
MFSNLQKELLSNYRLLIPTENILQALRYIGFQCYTINVTVNRPRTCQNSQWIIYLAHVKIQSVFGSKILSIIQSADGKNMR